MCSEEGTIIGDTGIAGEICVAGTALSLGYYNAPQETAKAFVQDPNVSAYPQTMYRTGDMAYYDANGDLCFVGRMDFQIKHQGHRIELSEIENVMLGLNGVRRAVCLYDGPSDKIIAFYCGEARAERVRVLLRGKLPPYMIPHKCIPVENFALTENGKIDRKKLREEYLHDEG